MPNHDEGKDSQRVVIVGASFGALSAATGLAWPQFQVMLIDQHNYHLLQPLLYQVADRRAAGLFRPRRSGCPLCRSSAGRVSSPASPDHARRTWRIRASGRRGRRCAAQVTLAGMSVNG